MKRYVNTRENNRNIKEASINKVGSGVRLLLMKSGAPKGKQSLITFSISNFTRSRNIVFIFLTIKFMVSARQATKDRLGQNS